MMVRSLSHIGEPLRQLKTSKGKDVATICEGRVQTGAEFVDRIARLSVGLRRLGLNPGERVCIAAFNSEWYLEWLLAVPCAGCIIAPLNHRWSVGETSEAINEAGASMLVVDRQCVGWCTALRKLCPSLKWFVYLAGGEPPINGPLIDAESLIQLAGANQPLELILSPDGIALICFTSGTTGRPKGVSLSHTALIVQSRTKITEVGYSSNDIYLHAATLCHIGGISSALAVVMINGCHILLPKFELQAAFRSIDKHKVSAMIVVPSLVSDMASYCYNSARVAGESVEEIKIFPSMRTVLNGAGSLSEDQLRAMKDIFPSAKVMTAYGMTEACSSMTFLLLHDPQQKVTQESYNYAAASNRMLKTSENWQTFRLGGVCVGKPAPHVEIRIMARNEGSNAEGSIIKNFTSMKMGYGKSSTLISSKMLIQDNGLTPDNLMDSRIPGLWETTRRRIVGRGSPRQADLLVEDGNYLREREAQRTVGSVLTRGPHVMEGYWGRPEKTKEALHTDGWLDTGDVGWIDEAGMLWLLGRQKDVVKSGGENVYASEVERLLIKHPAIGAAAVVGVPDPRLGEAVTAMVRLEPGWEWDDERIRTTAEVSPSAEKIVSERLLRIHCQQHGLSRYKVPKFILTQEGPFPVTTTGKVKKDSVRDTAIAQLRFRKSRDSSSLSLKPSDAREGILLRSRL